MLSKKKTGTREWSDVSLNIQKGCEHGCRYCYARYDKVVRFKNCTAEEWNNPVINQKKVDGRYNRNLGTVMFPTTHDITPNNINEYCCVLRKLLDAGNKVLIVTKPHIDCIKIICEGYREYIEQITFRFTIGSAYDDTLSFWEPHAPGIQERLECLRYAFECGYKTSVSCEPYLDPYIARTFTVCEQYITDSFWIGKLRNFDSRVNLEGVTKEQIANYVEPLKAIQGDSVAIAIYQLYGGSPLIKWKDSIRKVIEKGVIA